MNTNSFQRRHIGPSVVAQEKMLATINAESLAQLIDETVPDNIRLKSQLDLAPAMSGYQYLAHIKKLSERSIQKLHWLRIPRSNCTERNSTQYLRKPRLVYRVYSLPSRNCTRET